MTKILDGRKVAKKLNQETKKEIERLKEQGLTPTLAIVRADQNPASVQYEKMATKYMEKLGIQVEYATFPEDVQEEVFLDTLDQLNNHPEIHGIIVMQPLPKHIHRVKVAQHISPQKDIDGMHALNLGKIMAEDKEALLPSTVKAVAEILKYYNIEVKGQTVCVVGKSNTVGKPLTVLLMNLDATVINCHTNTKNLKQFTKQADILITATGEIGLITKDHVQNDAVVLDVGFNFKGNKVYGDVVYDEVSQIANAITPVPGGVGSVTTASLARQLALAAEWSTKK
ncbi:MAG TPA: bifunctional 5,10-methylenetetrahydrofolate dehydrogenase/5,10-methenyltetrahydrofolate cyclohydrolase [Candidatus Atopostipes pullistercoris]|uniref:Bifunctional protein FolD n=1 Tax=Candidatus Atopostipes pullistercoris TaxID=2838467 RepID=A0A9D2JXW8_9LACT|nr:bifunctional 5,10-methylenetetrahydrofolate dehydrogenase/5,10-methenyltetrahydrofolate cyclohydrolase [Candidatus Atopostipes pullistercoris]